jgi:hypothetical protein
LRRDRLEVNILKGWTPEAHGIFTDDLNRARHELASNFEAKSSGIAPVASGNSGSGLESSGPGISWLPELSWSRTQQNALLNDEVRERFAGNSLQRTPA